MLTLRVLQEKRRIEVYSVFGRSSFLPSSFAEMKPFEEALATVVGSGQHGNQITARNEMMALHACLFPAIITHVGRIRELNPYLSDAKTVADKRGLNGEPLTTLRRDSIVSREEGLALALRMFRLCD